MIDDPEIGRVVYLSDDTVFALKRWLRWRDPEKVFIFWGKGDAPMWYSTARCRFVQKVR